MIKTVLKTHRKLAALFPASLLRRFWWMQLLIAFTSVIDLFGLAAFIPVLSAIANPALLSSNRYFLLLKTVLHVDNDRNFLLALFSIVFMFFVFRSVFIVFSQNIQNKLVFSISEHIGSKAFDYYMHQPFERLMKINSANVIRELTVNPTQFARYLFMPLLLINSELIMLLMVVSGIAFFNFSVFLLLCATILPTAYLFQRLVKKRLNHFGKEQNRQTPHLYMNSNRGILGFMDAKLRSKENVLQTDYMRVLHNLNQINIRISTLNIMPAKLFELVTFAGLFLIFLFSIITGSEFQSIISIIVLYAAAGYRVIPSLSKLVPAFMQLEQYAYLFDTYASILSSKPEHARSVGKESLHFNSHISLRDVSFGYADAADLLFNNLNMTIQRGEIIGLIGKSGSGKTSLVNLMIGFLKPSAGDVLVDGVHLTEANVRSWMNQISYVQQSPYLEPDSLAANIAFLEDGVDELRLQEAIKRASLDTFLAGRNPAEVMLQEGGKNLSGGQKQRICIARALYHNSKLLILDEATSALDTQTELEVTETIKKLRGSGVTVIIIAHRYSTLAYTDRIFEIQGAGYYSETSYNEVVNRKEANPNESLV